MSALPAWFSIHPIDWKPAVGRLYDRPDGEHSRREGDMIRHIGIRPIIFSVNCYIAAVLALFISFSLDLKSSAWAMVTVYLTSQPLSGALRAKAVYRVVGTFVGGAVMVAIVPNMVNAPELTTLAIILWVALCVFVSLLDRTPRSYMFVLSGYTAALIGFPSVLAPSTVFDTAVSRVEEITLGVVCAAIVHSLILPIDPAKRDLARSKSLTDVAITRQQVERAQQATDEAQAKLDAANAALDVARLNLERSTVLAPVKGIVTNFDLLPGRYVNVGAAVFALIDSDSFRVEGYFEETKLRRIRVGEEATVKLIGDLRVLSGHVESIAYGIEDQNRSTSSELLASVNPTFSWVRLAQRIPVRIKLDYAPADILLVAGRTATVSIGKIRWW